MLSDDQLLRYARNILLNQVDVDGQETLLASHVAVVGAGGLGSPLIQYLAAAGIGTLSVIDDDAVDETNLQRQVIHDMTQIGKPKVSSATEFIRRLNPDVKVIQRAERLNDENVHTLLGQADLVVIGTDNFASRYLVNRYCFQNKRPMVSGAAIGTSGQVTSFNFVSEHDACFECVYENGADDQLTCATAGVLGPVVGTIGSIMALEVIKLLLGMGQPLIGRLLTWDALTMEWQTFIYQKNSECSACKT